MISNGTSSTTARLVTWLVTMALLGWVAATSRYTADLSAFLPAAPTAEQQLLVDQIRYGPVSRILLVALQGEDANGAAERSALSRALADRLRPSTSFTSVNNGTRTPTEKERELLFGHRYLLGDAVDAKRLGKGMHAAIGQSIEQIASPMGLALKDLLVRDPTGEVMRLIERLEPLEVPLVVEGTWGSADSRRALIMVQLRDDGTETDAQQRALGEIDQAWAEVSKTATRPVELLVSGTARFAVESREQIQRDVSRLSTLGTLMIVALLLWVYRSPRRVLLGLMPVATGVLAGIAAVRLGFGEVHGITLGFGVALIGESIDYGIYLFVQGSRPRLWRTIGLGLVTSLIGFSALLLSGFPGLAQLGLFAISGLLAAFVVSRLLLTPWVGSEPVALPRAAGHLARGVLALRRLRLVPLVALVTAALAVGWFSHHGALWERSLEALSPISDEDKRLDERLRADLRAPDVRYVLAITGNNEDQALARAGQVSHWLDGLVERGVLSGYESPSRLIPDEATQRRRRDALPDARTLSATVRSAVNGLPLKPERLAPFMADIEASRQLEPLRAADLRDTSLELAVDSMIVPGKGYVTAIMPLHPPFDDHQTMQLDIEQVRRAVGLEPEARGSPADPLPADAVHLVDMKHESDALYARYLVEARWLSLAGAVLIVALLVGTRRHRFWRIVVPLAAATLGVVALLAAAGIAMSLLHLVGMLLTVAVGSNYALFFADDDQDDDPRVLFSLLLAAATTTIGFGILAFADVPVLTAIGLTVGPGAILSLLFSAMLSGHDPAAPSATKPAATEPPVAAPGR